MDTDLLYLANRNCVDGDGKCTICHRAIKGDGHFERHIGRGQLTRGNLDSFKYIAPPAMPEPDAVRAALGLSWDATDEDVVQHIETLKGIASEADETIRISKAAVIDPTAITAALGIDSHATVDDITDNIAEMWDAIKNAQETARVAQDAVAAAKTEVDQLKGRLGEGGD